MGVVGEEDDLGTLSKMGQSPQGIGGPAIVEMDQEVVGDHGHGIVVLVLEVELQTGETQAHKAFRVGHHGGDREGRALLVPGRRVLRVFHRLATGLPFLPVAAPAIGRSRGTSCLTSFLHEALQNHGAGVFADRVQLGAARSLRFLASAFSA